MQEKTNNFIILSAALFLGLSIAGFSIGYGMYSVRKADRFVTVKGLAERIVPADLTIWPITFSITGNNLTEIHTEIDQNRKKVFSFLISHGFDSSSISFAPPQIRDSQEYGSNNSTRFRFFADATVTLRSSQVEKVQETMEDASSLVSQGVILAQQSWQNSTEFLFEGLNEIKPDMIHEATINARKAAVTFAEDSDSRLGGIRRASQGFFSISDRDRNSPELKKIRVVTTIEYFLVD